MRYGSWLVVGLLLVGCDRAYYRRAADHDAYALTASRIVDPTFDVGSTQLDRPPASRLHDPFDPDRPPKPPDDPAAALFMERPGGIPGGRRWDRYGYTDSIEYHGWLSHLGLDEKQPLKLTQDKSMELALLNSREYQTNLESLYFTALDLSLSRFQFAPQLFAGQSTTYSHFGTGPNASNTLTLDQRFGFTKALATGGQFLVDFANSFVFEFSQGGGQLMPTNLVFSLIQPLLRRASREVRLEGLTQDERDLLYAVRDFARFRKQFWADITTQSGYLNLLLQLQGIRNEQANLRSQEQNYRLHQELFDGGFVSRVQVDRAFREFLGARLNLAQAEAALQTSLDAFKMRLGLPPRIPVELDDSKLQQFQLVAPELETLREDTANFELARFKELNQLPPLDSLRQSYEALRGLMKRVPDQFELVAMELVRAEQKLAEPSQSGSDTEQRVRTREDYERFRKIMTEVRTNLDSLPERLEISAKFDESTRRQAWDRLVRLTSDLLRQIDDLIAIETVVRINMIELPALTETEDTAICYALENRLDLMNAKGQVTDAWRKVSVAANALWADLNINASANLANDPLSGNPLGFTSARNRYTVGFSFDAPLNRFAERNLYRMSLVNYQRARRSYMGLSDRIEQQVRLDLRQLNVERLSFETARQNLISAARQVESARSAILDRRNAANTSTTIDILNALDALLAARNALARSYISYEQLRVQLLLDMERLRLDSRGFSIDEPASSLAEQPSDPDPVSEPLPPPRPIPAPG